jgi:hypothetical protein
VVLGIFGGLWGLSYFSALLIGSSLRYLIISNVLFYNYYITIFIFSTGQAGYGFALGIVVVVLGLIHFFLPDKFELPNFSDEESHENLLDFE